MSVITVKTASRPVRARRDRPRAHWTAYLWATLLVAAVTGVCVAGREVLALPDKAMLHLLIIMIVAAWFGRGPSILAAALSVAAYDVFSIPPFYTFAVHDVRHILTFVMMFGVGLVISGLMEHAKGAARKARTEELRSSLLSAVSHDLRTPLGAITGAATTLRDADDLAPGQRDELLDTVCEEAEHLERLVGNLLDMTRLESGALEVKRAWVPLEEIVGAALTRLESRLEGRDVRIDVAPELPLVSVDPVLLGQVFVNLLENAAKHTPPASGIEIGAHAVDGAVTIEVADRGPGLPPDAEALFERFVRGPQAASAGTGLGLSVCRGVVEAHGGTIGAENRPDGGALFRVRLPLVGRAPAVADAAETTVAGEGAS